MGAVWAGLLASIMLCGCEQGSATITDAERGRELLWQYGCGACHDIPGVKGAKGSVGPPLADMKRRVYLAGILPNTRDNLVLWIGSPQLVDPQTAMPDVGVTASQARDMAAYLYSAEAGR